jgi:hypothetical protein
MRYSSEADMKKTFGCKNCYSVKLIMFALFDAYATNMITVINLMMIPILAFSLYIGL